VEFAHRCRRCDLPGSAGQATRFGASRRRMQ
jgi:hypothetical protein